MVVVKTKVLITGSKGQLGHDLLTELSTRDYEAIGVDINDLDITKKGDVDEFIMTRSLDAVIHCAAYTAVDMAETDIENCMKINSLGTDNIADACKRKNIKMMYISTDYVFNGEGSKLWQPDDKCDPVNRYGYSKYLGEISMKKHLKKFFILRTAWLFGSSGSNFVKTMISLSENEDIRVVNDQFGSPTYTKDLSFLISEIIKSDNYGIYHATNEGFCSWYEFACEIFRQMNIDINIIPVDSLCFYSKAKRPYNSRLEKNKLVQNGFKLLPRWENALNRYLREIGLIE